MPGCRRGRLHDVGGSRSSTPAGGHHDQAVVGDPDAATGADRCGRAPRRRRAVGEAHRGRAVPRLHQRGVELRRTPAGRVHRLVALPASGIIISTACGRLRPPRCSSSSTSSNGRCPRRLGCRSGRSARRSSGGRRRRRCRCSASRARIQFSLPVTVLISPLWATRRNGWPAATTEGVGGELGFDDLLPPSQASRASSAPLRQKRDAGGVAFGGQLEVDALRRKRSGPAA